MKSKLLLFLTLLASFGSFGQTVNQAKLQNAKPVGGTIMRSIAGGDTSLFINQGAPGIVEIPKLDAVSKLNKDNIPADDNANRYFDDNNTNQNYTPGTKAYVNGGVLMGLIQNGQQVSFEEISTVVDANTKQPRPVTNADIDGVKIRKRGSKFYKIVTPSTYNVRLFGANGDDDIDDTQAIQKAIDAVAGTFYTQGKWGAIYFPTGVYIVSSITLREKLKLFGDGESTVIKAKPGVADSALVQIRTGVTSNIIIEDMNFVGAGASNPQQMGWYFHARPAPGNALSGVTNAMFRNIRIENFYNHSMWFRAANDLYGPHQYMWFENVQPTNNGPASSRALLMTGNCYNNGWRYGNITYSPIDGKIGVELSGEYKNGNTIGGKTVGGTRTVIGNGGMDFDQVNFVTHLMQDRTTTAIYLEKVGIRLDKCQIENASKGIFAEEEAGVKVSNLAFLQTGKSPLGDGFLIRNTSVKRAIAEKVSAQNAPNNLPDSYFRGRIRSYNFDTPNSGGLATVGVSSQLSVYKNAADKWSIDINASTTSIINTSENAIQTINADNYSPGEFITLQANAGPVSFVSSDNIFLGGDASLTLQNGQTALFIKYDLRSKWTLVSTAYSKVASDLRYKPIAYQPAWAEITAKPYLMAVSEAVNDLNSITGQRFFYSSSLASNRPAPFTGNFAQGIQLSADNNSIYKNLLLLDENGNFVLRTVNPTTNKDDIVLTTGLKANLADVSSGLNDVKYVTPAILKSSLPTSFVYSNAASGTTSISIPHSLGTVPSSYSVYPENANAAGISWYQPTATSIILHYSTAPTGTLNYRVSVTK